MFKTKVLFFLYLLLSPYLMSDGHIFVYHRFDDNRYPSTNTSLQELRKEFTFFKTHNYQVVPLMEMVKKVQAHEKIPDNWVALTIDDGFKSFYTNGLPLFREFNYPFTLFVAVKYTQEHYRDYVSWHELQEIAKYGDVEFHSYGHGHYGQMSDDAIRSDMDKGLALMKEHLAYEPRLFVYPYGEYDDRVDSILQTYHFQGIFNQNMGAVDGECSNPYDLDRSALVGNAPFKLFLTFQELCGVTFEQPTHYPKDKTIKKVEITLQDKTIKTAEIFISNNGWSRVKVNQGKILWHANKKVKRDRIKIGVKVGHKIKLMVLSKE